MWSCNILLKFWVSQDSNKGYSHGLFVVDHTIEDALVCDAASRIAAAVVSEGEALGFSCHHTKIRFLPLSDKAHFWLNGYLNKQNCRIWSEANPQVYVETPLHPEKLTVWCALWAGGILLQKR
ncbi:hypothetical protein TNCV_1437851 [Trichonephila clavipes]|nr:hypothetical protein TNCV_1437851 [Trichonephila clavipes]